MVEQMKEREVTDVATLKALADPLRLAVLGALMKHDPEPLSVKEIAAELEEAPTKLYRHVKQLEQAELVFVAETRLVSGIVESRYRSAQHSLRLSPQVYAEGDEPPAALGAMLAAMDLVRADFQRKFLAGRVDLTPAAQGNPLPGKFAHTSVRLTREQLLKLRARLDEALDEVFGYGESTDPDAVEVNLFALMYTVKPEPPQPN
ncbi:helix-turn-helix domain-containing protein [Streptomyces sp. TLI_171]|uniref:winged helix-turn-helix domain-containing protein n=1 Tax=Streptomyces sp. TLI_171 TaxID=1938859 RepID=UPI00117C2E6D|nr:helix-turn-helix domain-containing protein [Streptomyces sp. TLI_171]